MDELFGLPTHPLVVHAPVVLLPVAVIGVVATMIRPTWYARYRWLVLAVTAVGAVAAIVAAGTGEELEERVEEGASGAARRAIEEHAEAGEAARLFAVLFLVAVVAYVVVPWFLARRERGAAAVADAGDTTHGATLRVSWLRPVLMVAVAATAVGSLVTIVNAGHSGADSVWGDLPAGEVDDGDGDGD
jgi:hypothetical protein